MATSTNVKIGKQPRWNDELQYFIFGTDQKMTLIMADRLAAHNESATQLFVEAEIDLTKFLGKKKMSKDTFSNWYNLKHDGKNCGSIQFCFEFEERPLSPEEQSMESLPMAHMYDDVFKQWAHHAKSCDYHESHSYPVNTNVEDVEMHIAPDDGQGCMGMTRFDVKTPFDRVTCAEEAKSLGFSIKDTDNAGATIIYKEQEVVTGILESWYADDGDYLYYEDITVYVWNGKVIYSGY